MNFKRTKYIIYLITFGLFACSDDPVACFDIDPVSGVVNQSIYLKNCSTNSDQYQWDFGDGSESTDANPIHTYSDTGTYTIQLRAISDFGGTNSLFTQSIRIMSPSEKFLGSYQARLNSQYDYLLQVRSGNTWQSLLFFLDGVLFCNGNCAGNMIIVNQQNYWSSDFKVIVEGAGELRNDSILLDIIVHDSAGLESRINLTANKIEL